MGQDRAGEMRAVTSGAVLCTRRGGRTSEADREKRTSEGRQAHVLHGVAARYRALRGAGPGPAVRHGTGDSRRGPGVMPRRHRRTAAARQEHLMAMSLF